MHARPWDEFINSSYVGMWVVMMMIPIEGAPSVRSTRSIARVSEGKQRGVKVVSFSFRAEADYPGVPRLVPS